MFNNQLTALSTNNSTAVPPMAKFLKAHNATLGFRTKGNTCKCILGFPEQGMKIVGVGTHTTDAYNNAIYHYEKFLQTHFKSVSI